MHFPAHKGVKYVQRNLPNKQMMGRRMKNRNLVYVLKKFQDSRIWQIVMVAIGNKKVYYWFQNVVLNNVTLDIIILK